MRKPLIQEYDDNFTVTELSTIMPAPISTSASATKKTASSAPAPTLASASANRKPVLVYDDDDYNFTVTELSSYKKKYIKYKNKYIELKNKIKNNK